MSAFEESILRTREISFRDSTFSIASTHPEDTYFADASVFLPPAVHVAAAICNPSSTIIDVGANLGLCTLAFSRIAPTGRIISFEPGDRAFGDLERSIAANDALNIEAHQMALGATNQEVVLLQPTWNTSASFVFKATSAASQMHAAHAQVESVTVSVSTLDSMVEILDVENLDFLKIDVEGHEDAVLEGARQTLERFRPPTLIELNVFTLSVLADRNPLTFLLDLVAKFPHVLAISNHLEQRRIDEINVAYELIHRCFLLGEVWDLLCSWSPLERELATLGNPADQIHAEATDR